LEGRTRGQRQIGERTPYLIRTMVIVSAPKCRAADATGIASPGAIGGSIISE